MRGSKEIIWELGAVIKSKGNLPIKSIIVSNYKTSLDVKFRCYCQENVGEFLGNLFNASLSKVIKGIHINYWVTGQHCHLTVWIEDSKDGQTNIDENVIDAFSKLKWKNGK